MNPLHINKAIDAVEQEEKIKRRKIKQQEKRIKGIKETKELSKHIDELLKLLEVR